MSGLERTTRRQLFFILLLGAVTTAAYLNSLDGAFVFDDSRIYNNPGLRLESFSLPGLIHAVRTMEPATRPVANLTFVLNYLAHGLDVRGFHLANLCIHVGTGILLFFLLQVILAGLPAAERPEDPVTLSFVSALFWLVHPLQTQAVSYIVQRMTSLSAFFVLLCLLLYAAGRKARSADKRFLCLAGSLLAGLLALGSKETAVMLPVLILLYEWFFVRDRRAGIRGVWWGVVVAGTVAALSFLFTGGAPFSLVEKGYAIRSFTPLERVLTEGRVIFFYLGLLIFPHPSRLSLEHDFPLSSSLLQPRTTLLSFIVISAAVAWALTARRHRLLAFGILWFLANHLVEGTILPLELVFEHRNYLPSMMLFPPLAAGLFRLVKDRRAQALLVCVVVALLSLWTFQRNRVWKDRVSLWSDCVAKAPNLARAHNNLAVALKSEGRLAEAITHYRETVRLDPLFVEAWYNLGNALMIQGNPAGAVEYYRRAAELVTDRAVFRLSLANALFDSGRYQEAAAEYTRALRLEPANQEARLNLERAQRMARSLEQRMRRETGR